MDGPGGAKYGLSWAGADGRLSEELDSWAPLGSSGIYPASSPGALLGQFL